MTIALHSEPLYSTVDEYDASSSHEHRHPTFSDSKTDSMPSQPRTAQSQDTYISQELLVDLHTVYPGQ